MESSSRIYPEHCKGGCICKGVCVCVCVRACACACACAANEPIGRVMLWNDRATLPKWFVTSPTSGTACPRKIGKDTSASVHDANVKDRQPPPHSNRNSLSGTL